VSFAAHGATSTVEPDKKGAGGAGGKRKRGGTATTTALNESGGKAEEKKVKMEIEDIDDAKTTAQAPQGPTVSSIAPKFTFKMKVPAAARSCTSVDFTKGDFK
jgi:hypothetical protein